MHLTREQLGIELDQQVFNFLQAGGLRFTPFRSAPDMVTEWILPILALLRERHVRIEVEDGNVPGLIVWPLRLADRIALCGHHGKLGHSLARVQLKHEFEADRPHLCLDVHDGRGRINYRREEVESRLKVSPLTLGEGLSLLSLEPQRFMTHGLWCLGTCENVDQRAACLCMNRSGEIEAELRTFSTSPNKALPMGVATCRLRLHDASAIKSKAAAVA